MAWDGRKTKNHGYFALVSKGGKDEDKFLVASLLCLIAFSTSTFAERELLSCQEAAEQVRYAAQAKKGSLWFWITFQNIKSAPA